MALSLSGQIRETSIIETLDFLKRQSATGTLTFQHEGVEKTLYLKDGRIVFADSRHGQDRLGEVLVKARLITPEQLASAIELSKKSAGLKKFGAILVEHGMLSPRDLFAGLKLQVKGIVFSLLLWTDGGYRFVSEAKLPPDILTLQVNVDEIAREVVAFLKNG